MTETHSGDKTIFGFWVYLMTDLIMFGVLFAAFAVLRNNTFGGPPAKELFSLPFVLTETLILLTSSFTCGLALLWAHKNEVRRTVSFLFITLILGLVFLGMELSEFSELIHEGNSFQRSAFLSSFFTLVGTHGLHIASGIVWVTILIVQILRRGLTPGNFSKITLFSLFWHFLDIVWIFIFTVVYLMSWTTN
jgi:cytochrome o ubiquinol oxidase subunit 3